MTRKPSVGKRARRARRLAARRPDHVRALVPVVCLQCGRFQMNRRTHLCLATEERAWMLEEATLRARLPGGADSQYEEALRLAWTYGLIHLPGRPARVLVGMLTPCACGALEARYAEAA